MSLALDRLPEVPIRQLWSPQTCPAAQLPWLAWALSVDEWDATWPEETKRQVIAASIEQHRKKGTVGALRRALQRLGYEVEIDEQTGVAYTFRLRFKVREGESSAGAVLDQAVMKATTVALRQKNARSELIDIALLGEGGTAGLYAGGAPISGAEVEIKDADAVVTLPLDGYSTGMLCSFWTTRMHSDYTGPIARVRRASDGAHLSYKTLFELRRFVEGTTWHFVRLFNQRGSGLAIAYDEPPEGEFDANGVPRMRNTSVSSTAFLVWKFPSFQFSASSMVCAAAYTGDLNTTTAGGISLSINNGVTDRFYQLNMEKERASAVLIETDTGYGIGVYDEGKLAGAAVTRLNSSALTAQFGVEFDDTAPFYVGPYFTQANIGPGFPDDAIYGGAIWKNDIGADAAAAIITAIETELQL